jgi:protein tyrosine phosphatase (PTP) superfamily phosphohydrolase (DUF442 family)
MKTIPRLTRTLTTLTLFTVSVGLCLGASALANPAAAEVSTEAPAAAVSAAEEMPSLPSIDIPNAGMPSAGVLTGGQPSEEALAQAAAAGYKTIINLRATGESIPFDERATVERLGMEYISLPIAGIPDLTAEKAKELVEILAKPGTQPSMVHCASGNRVGALFALGAFFLDGKKAEGALEFGRQAGLTRLEPVVRKLLAAEAAPSG